ncbi:MULTISPECIES: LppM family (lipo)protein [Actinomyces]|uniref:LppM domain-containing protein n=1 Tax=Actinomyces respiraculi TaxID=2744574 RepID=A0A7T0LK78_9ACTO|nr:MULTISPECIES: hypothetical protein [Actinomyces]QPL05190.1 hypothetical protein ID810_10765 [Actinomyces respiraculi]
MPDLPHRRPALRRTRLLAALGLLAIALAGCTAHMDMTLKEDGTYDVVLDVRDSTGTVLTPDSNCADYADPALVGSPVGTSVSSRSVGSADDAGGVGCEVTISGVTVPDASAVSPSPDGSAPLVVRDGDLYVVDLSALQGAVRSDGVGQGGAPSQAGVVDARVTLTFPGAVVTSGGGLVEGTTVTWSDVDVLSDGVSASGYATPGAGLSVWDRHSGWVIGGVVLAGLAIGAAAWYRRAAAGRAAASRSDDERKAPRSRPAPRRASRRRRR